MYGCVHMGHSMCVKVGGQLWVSVFNLTFFFCESLLFNTTLGSSWLMRCQGLPCIYILFYPLWDYRRALPLALYG